MKGPLWRKLNGDAPGAITENKIDVEPGLLKAEIEISDEQLDSFRTRAGQRAHEVLTAIMGKPAWVRMADVERRATVERVFSLARREARESVLDRDEVREAVKGAAEEPWRARKKRAKE